MEMLVASLVAFGSLVVAWIVLPASGTPRKQRQVAAGVSSDLAA